MSNNCKPLSGDWEDLIFAASRHFLQKEGFNNKIISSNKRLTIKWAITLFKYGSGNSSSVPEDVKKMIDRSFGYGSGSISSHYISSTIGEFCDAMFNKGYWNDKCDRLNRPDLKLQSDKQPFVSPILELTSDQLSFPDSDANSLYNGSEATWRNIINSDDCPRELHAGVKNTINTLLTRKSARPYLILLQGPGSTGKSTLLKRILYDFSAPKKVKVLYIDLKYTNDSYILNQFQETFNSLCDSTTPIIIGIDEIYLTYLKTGFLFSSLKGMFPTKNIIVIGTEQASRVNSFLKNETGITNINDYKIFDLNLATDKDIEELCKKIDSLETNGRISKIGNFTMADRLAIFKKYASRHFVVAMYVLRYRADFPTVIEKEFKQIPSEKAQQLVLYIAFMNTIGCFPPFNLLLAVLELQDLDFEELRSNTIYIVQESIEMNGFQLRHSIIAHELINSHKIKSPTFLRTFIMVTIKKIDPAETHQKAFLKQLTERNNLSNLLQPIIDNRSEQELLIKSATDLLMQIKTRDKVKFLNKLIGVLYKQLGEYSNAIDHYETYLSTTTSTVETAYILVELAWCNFNLNEYAKAKESIIQACNKHENSRNLKHTIQILLHGSIEDHKLADKYFKKLLALPGDNAAWKEKYSKYQKEIVKYSNQNTTTINLSFKRFTDLSIFIEPSLRLEFIYLLQKEFDISLDIASELKNKFYKLEVALKEKESELTDKKFVSNLYCNLGYYYLKLLRIEKYHLAYDYIISPDRIFNVLTHSVEFDPDNAEALSLLGTYYKDASIPQDLRSALHNYGLAISKAELPVNKNTYYKYLHKYAFNKALIHLDLGEKNSDLKHINEAIDWLNFSADKRKNNKRKFDFLDEAIERAQKIKLFLERRG